MKENSRESRYVAGEVLRNYAQLEYEPPRGVIGRARAETLLFQSGGIAGCVPALEELVQRATDVVGVGQTAFGVKFSDGRPSWELYWYAHSLSQPLTLGLVGSIFPESVVTFFDLSTTSRHFSISVDIGPDGRIQRPEHGVAVVHLYVVHPSQPGTCISYGCHRDGLRLENTYFLYGGPDPRVEVSNWLAASPLSPAADRVIWDELVPCDHVALAHKPNRDGIYYGGIDYRRFLRFGERVGLPELVIDQLSDGVDQLDHLLIDVGFDYEIDGDDVRVVKSAYYASF